ncbi:type II secretion system protein [Shewanella marina]|uniref:type II secretion system protein n=1 Tax=Shewanella marina TaxID=487319 RepID=UPI000688D07D|nr:prepilin-type N-terminal cleavage/methylation domain-containing protein [Shewanella marina]
MYIGKRQGFTLVELVVVIIILGVLAVVAAPKFIGLSEDAIAATNTGTAGAMRSAIQLTRSKLMVEQGHIPDVGIVRGPDDSTTNDDIGLYKGYPECAVTSCGINGITRWTGCVGVFALIMEPNPFPVGANTCSGNNSNGDCRYSVAIEDNGVLNATGSTCLFTLEDDSRFQIRYNIADGSVITTEPSL